MNRKVIVAGVGMLPFAKPGASESYPMLGARAAKAALDDARVDYQSVNQVYAGYVYGDSCSGQAAVYHVGLTSVPVINVNNNCATGSTALFLARQAVASGAAECVLALGFEQMARGALGVHFQDRPDPSQRLLDTMQQIQGTDVGAPIAAQLFGGAGRMHMQLYGTRADTFARIAVKARRHAQNNPNAIFRQPLTLDEVLASPAVFDPLTRLQCCPPTCGGAAAVLCSEDFARRHGLDARVRIAAQAMSTDGNSSFDEKLGFAPEGGAERFVLDGDNTYGGRVVTNPSGGLLSKGHPLGATGLAQCAELVWQLRGQAGARQVEGARVALQHNLGLGGACVVTLYQRD